MRKPEQNYPGDLRTSLTLRVEVRVSYHNKSPQQQGYTNHGQGVPQRNPSIDTLERLAAALGKQRVVALVELDDDNEETEDENETTTVQNEPSQLES